LLKNALKSKNDTLKLLLTISENIESLTIIE